MQKFSFPARKDEPGAGLCCFFLLFSPSENSTKIRPGQAKLLYLAGLLIG
jgi:hypothetical protein